MYRSSQAAIGVCNELSFQYIFANTDDWLRRVADVLGQWQNQLIGNGCSQNLPRRCNGFFRRQSQSAVKFSQVVGCSRTHRTISRLMQSTGHGGRHSSQPVHSEAMTVCIKCCAPIMASTGQALRQCMQPMHTDSSMTATELTISVFAASSSSMTSRPSSDASLRIVSSPPGGQRLVFAFPAAKATA